MLVPTGGGPPLHRHDFEEMFTVLEGEIEFTFRGETVLAKSGTTLNIPANAPHRFKNVAATPAQLLCVCSPAGQEEFFLEIGKVVERRTTLAPHLSAEEQKSFIEKGKSNGVTRSLIGPEVLSQGFWSLARLGAPGGAIIRVAQHCTIRLCIIIADVAIQIASTKSE